MRKKVNNWLRQLYCSHPKEDRELVVVGGAATVENIIERCSVCHKSFGKPRLET
jgi:hypothetical protein